MIGNVIKREGDVYHPTQLGSVIHLARQKQPYKLKQLEFDGFIDLNSLSKDLRISGSREEGEGSWNSIMEVRDIKSSPYKIFFKDTHNELNIKEINLKRSRRDGSKTILICRHQTKQYFE